MRIAEIYASLQGEGILAGTPSVFVRTSGCNLRCHWCDTPFTSWEPVGEQRPVDDVFETVMALDRDHVVITGGEPLLFPDVADLTGALRERGLHVTIETAGTIWLDTGADLVSISPKLATRRNGGGTTSSGPSPRPPPTSSSSSSNRRPTSPRRSAGSTTSATASTATGCS